MSLKIAFDPDPLYVFLFFVGGTVILAAEVLYLVFFRGETYRDQVNRRLRVLNHEPNREKALVKLRRERGLTAAGFYSMPVTHLNRLVLQSGVGYGVWRVLAAMLVSGIAGFIGVGLWRGSLLEAAGAGVIAGLPLPWLVLGHLRKRRMTKFAQQFPDAIDIIVRSIRAGHPVPIAIAMVAREMADPVGTEFGMLADELTYGAEMDDAMRSLYFRVGQEDLPLFVTAVAIQSTTGGNLAEILTNLSRVIRERFKMRRKVKALSSEGRFSALALSAMPILLFLVVNTMTPTFYGQIWHIPMTQIVLGMAVGWMLVGNMIMLKMVNFKV